MEEGKAVPTKCQFGGAEGVTNQFLCIRYIHAHFIGQLIGDQRISVKTSTVQKLLRDSDLIHKI